MIEKIISGGQTGVDQAALFVANKMGIVLGGWCPLGGLDENQQSIFKKYLLKEITGLPFSDSISERTKRNIDDSDGTLIIVPSIPLPKTIQDGTLLTIKHAIEKRKPYLLIAVNDESAMDQFKNWMQTYAIKTLNVAGPRESSCKGIYEQTCELLQKLFCSPAARANNVLPPSPAADAK